MGRSLSVNVTECLESRGRMRAIIASGVMSVGTLRQARATDSFSRCSFDDEIKPQIETAAGILSSCF